MKLVKTLLSLIEGIISAIHYSVVLMDNESLLSMYYVSSFGYKYQYIIMYK